MGVRTEKPYAVFYRYSKTSPVSRNISDLTNNTTKGNSFINVWVLLFDL